MNLVSAIRKSRIRSLVAVFAVAGSALGATLAQPVAADAAEFHTSVACMESASSPVASHSCLANELPAVYFESTVATWFDLCVEAPNHEVSCSGDHFAEADHRYYWPITAREVGTYTATAWVGEYEVGVWRFLVELSSSASAGAPSPSDGSLMPSPGSAAVPSLELGATPSSLEVGAAPTLGAAPMTSPVCQAAAKQVSKLMGELKHASKRQVRGLESKLKAAKAKAKKAC
jgi:hypothetical protein